MTLYEITSDYMKLLEMAQDPEMDPEVIADTLEGIEGELEWKAENTAKVIRELEAKAAALKAEAERFQKRQKAAENNAKNLKARLEDAMKVTGKTKFETDLFKFRIQNNAPSVQLADDLDISLVPLEFCNIDVKVNKSAVKDALKQGQTFDWAELVTTESLRIQ